jgi:hypothetical protein
MSSRLRTFAAASTLLFAVTGAEAQTWRTIDVSRQLGDTGALSVRLEYGAGKLDLRPTTTSTLYLMNLKYDAERSEPLSRFDAAARTLAIGIRSHGMRLHSGSREAGSLHAELSTRVPMDLSLELGAVQGDVQLGGLKLTDLSLKAGAADLTVRFDEPNPYRVHTMTLEVGAADVKLIRAGNSGVEHVNANIGVGALDLDLGGELTHDVEVSGNLAMGDFTLHVPRDVGVYVDATTFLAEFDKTGLVKRSDGWYTPGFDEARRRVRVRIKAFIGDFTLSRDAR